MITIDAREPDEFNDGHVKHAINIPVTQMGPDSSALLSISKNDELVIYCRSGGRSAAAIDILKNMGYTNLTNGINKAHVEANILS